ncbi:MAG: N-acetylmuramoyl-L-alanine amidase [Flavobacteriales bacterium]|nr:N-acetylmuramoyl-L-alanine amidase [Flavobacteriales bacterium]
MEVKDHLLAGDAAIKPLVKSPNVSGPFKTGLPDTIIIHYTAGSSAESSVRSLCNPAAKASAHLVVGRDGSITQLVPFNIIAWHAGKSAYGDRVGYNNYAIGIEIDNAGVLTKTGDVYQAWFGRTYPSNEVLYAVHRNEKSPRYWHTYTEQQIEAVETICRALIPAYNIKTILGHEEISPGRKVDPGPAFPLDKMRERLLNIGGRDEDDAPVLPPAGRVNVDKLNIRSKPDVSGDTVAKPLEKGVKVKILDKSGNWYKITTEIEGWVSGQFLDAES